MDKPQAAGYQASIEHEKRLFRNCADVHELPPIFHYWSNRYLRPKLAPLGFSDAPQMFARYLDLQCHEQPGPRRFVSLGAGNCDLEIQLALELLGRGHHDFIFDCLELNPSMLSRGQVAARSAGVEAHLNLISADLNLWDPSCEYHAAIACHSLHHVVKLESLFDNVKRSLIPQGRFLISDMIGRNGHQRWPEALRIVDEFWKQLPPSYRYHNILKCYDATFEDRDCAHEGFEGVRAQDILPLLVDRFHFQMFAGFANVIDPFIDRGFGPNFDPGHAWDRHFIDEVHRHDAQELAAGRLKPTHMMAAVGSAPCACEVWMENRSPRQSIRVPAPCLVPPRAAAEYQWGSWPHHPQRELEIACSRLAESGRVIRQRNEEAQRLEEELDSRTKWLRHTEAQLDERTAHVALLQEDLAAHQSLVDHLRRERDDKSAWALDLEAERLRLEEKLREYDARVQALESELDRRSQWALALERELDEQRHRPVSLLSRIATAIRCRLTRPQN